MKSYLLDIVQHTFTLGNMDLVKITGTATDTAINAVAEDRSIILEGKFKAPIADFLGTFGMPNLGRLNTILNIPEYHEDAVLSVTNQTVNGVVQPAGIHFENKNHDFKNDYRFMSADIINDKLKSIRFKGVKWHVDFTPSVEAIQRLRFQASANSDQTTFIAKTENGALKFYFGDVSSHNGEFIFDPNNTGTLTTVWSWPIAAVINILGLAGEKKFKISSEGAAMITVDSGLAEYNYIIPAQTK